MNNPARAYSVTTNTGDANNHLDLFSPESDFKTVTIIADGKPVTLSAEQAAVIARALTMLASNRINRSYTVLHHGQPVFSNTTRLTRADER